MSAQDARGVVEGVVDAVAERYHREDVAAAIAAAVIARLEDGAYDEIAGGPELAARLTADLREVSGDDLLGVEYHAQATEPHEPRAPDADQAGEVDNFGFERAERLDGNIGLLVVSRFHAAEARDAGEAALAAMTFVAHTEALIVDLRGSRGGAASMVNLLSSFFFDGAVHLNTIRGRPNRPEHQNWTRPQVAGPRYRQPVYVLTGDTSGAAQDFACCLRALGRVTIVGEPLKDTGPLVAVGRLDACFDVFIPVGQPVHPRSGEPLGLAAADIPVEADRALRAACAAARRPARGADDRAEPAGRTPGS